MTSGRRARRRPERRAWSRSAPWLVLVAVVLTVGLTVGCASGDRPSLGTAPAVAVSSTVLESGLPTTTVDDASDDGVPTRSIVAAAIVPEVTVYDAPGQVSTTFEPLANPTDKGGPLVFLTTASDPEELGDEFIEVHLPVRPNGSTGWVARADVSLSTHGYAIVVSRSEHTLWVYDDGEVVVEAPVGIGTGETPTPIGSFYLKELLAPPNPNGAYGPFAFGLSGFSNELTDFAGGDGVVGLHGTNDPASIGTDVSHGCIRLDNDVISELATYLPLGTPVEILV